MSIEKPNKIESPSAAQINEFRSFIEAEKERRRLEMKERGFDSGYVLAKCDPLQLDAEDYLMYTRLESGTLKAEDVHSARDIASAEGNLNRIAFIDWIAHEFMGKMFLD